jgi:hypothetical protein
MKNPLYVLEYLYYKLTVKNWQGERTLMAAITFNVLTLYELVFQETPPPVFWILLILFVMIFSFSYFTTKREKMIISKFENESDEARIRGNTLTVLYVVGSIVGYGLVILWNSPPPEVTPPPIPPLNGH